MINHNYIKEKLLKESALPLNNANLNLIIFLLYAGTQYWMKKIGPLLY